MKVQSLTSNGRDVDGPGTGRASGDIGMGDTDAGAGGEQQGRAKGEQAVFHKRADEMQKSCPGANFFQAGLKGIEMDEGAVKWRTFARKCFSWACRSAYQDTWFPAAPDACASNRPAAPVSRFENTRTVRKPTFLVPMFRRVLNKIHPSVFLKAAKAKGATLSEHERRSSRSAGSRPRRRCRPWASPRRAWARRRWRPRAPAMARTISAREKEQGLFMELLERCRNPLVIQLLVICIVSVGHRGYPLRGGGGRDDPPQRRARLRAGAPVQPGRGEAPGHGADELPRHPRWQGKGTAHGRDRAGGYHRRSRPARSFRRICASSRPRISSSASPRSPANRCPWKRWRLPPRSPAAASSSCRTPASRGATC